MNENILLTSEKFVRENMVISDNVQSKFILPSIREAQEINLQMLIGSKMLAKLKTYPNAQPYSGLLDIIQYYLGYLTVANLVMNTSYHIDNFGTNQPTDENLMTLSLKDNFSLADYYNNKADFYAERIREYCLDNYNDLPELHDCKAFEMHANLNSSASCVVNLGGRRGKVVRNYRDHHINYDKP